MRRLGPCRASPAIGIEKYDEIDVAGIIQLEGAHLAHGEHDVAAALLGFGGSAGLSRPRAAASASRKRTAAERPCRRVRSARRSTRITGHTPPISASAISSAASALRAAQYAHRLGLVLGRVNGLRRPRRAAPPIRSGSALAAQQPRGSLAREFPKIRRTFGQARQARWPLSARRRAGAQRLAVGAAPISVSHRRPAPAPPCDPSGVAHR